MNSVFGKVVAIFFAACFVAVQFHYLDHTENKHNTGRIFHIEDARTSEIDRNIHNNSISAQVVQSNFSELSQRHLLQQKHNLKQQYQFKWMLDRKVKREFQKERQRCFAVFCEVYLVKLSTRFNFLQTLALTFEPTPTLNVHHKQIQSDESDNQIS